MQKLQSEENNSSSDDKYAKPIGRINASVLILFIMFLVMGAGFIWLIGWNINMQSSLYLMKQNYDIDIAGVELKIDSHLIDYHGMNPGLPDFVNPRDDLVDNVDTQECESGAPCDARSEDVQEEPQEITN